MPNAKPKSESKYVLRRRNGTQAIVVTGDSSYEHLFALAKTAGYNLFDLDLRGLDLSRVNFCSQDLAGSDFSSSNLQQANFSRCDLYDTRFNYCDVESADFTAATLGEARFVHSNLRGTLWSKTHLVDASFVDCDLRGALFWNTHVDETHLTRVRLALANFRGVRFDGFVFHGVDFNQLDFDALDLSVLQSNLRTFASRQSDNIAHIKERLYLGKPHECLLFLSPEAESVPAIHHDIYAIRNAFSALPIDASVANNALAAWLYSCLDLWAWPVPAPKHKQSTHHSPAGRERTERERG